MNNGLTNTYIRCAAAKRNTLFAGTNAAGIFISTNNGSDWSEANNGLTNLNIRYICIAGNYVFAGTQERRSILIR